jgi:hypothetical protein
MQKSPEAADLIARRGRSVQVSIFDLFAGHEVICELKAISAWLDDHRAGRTSPHTNAERRSGSIRQESGRPRRTGYVGGGWSAPVGSRPAKNAAAGG